MVTEQDIRDLAARIAAEFRPQKIILFGSRASGAPHEDSDVDLLVIMPFAGPTLRKTVEILDRVDPQFAVDLLLRTPEEAARRYEALDPIVREAFDRGRVLYEAAA
jgi:predicted nucleotidyltransferase